MMNTQTTERPAFEEVFLQEGVKYLTLGPAYFDARAVVDHVLPDGSDENMTQAMAPIIKKFIDDVYDQLSERVQSWLFSDVTSNLQGQLWRMTDACVLAILGKEQWAMDKYALGDRYDCEKIRKILCRMIPEELQNARLLEVEKELADVKADNARLRNRF